MIYNFLGLRFLQLTIYVQSVSYTHLDVYKRQVSFIQVDTLQKAKELPCGFNNFAVFYKGSFETVNLPPIDYLKRILKK